MNLTYLNENAQILIKNLKPSGYDQLKNLKIKNGTEIRILILPKEKARKVFRKVQDIKFPVNKRIDWYFKDKRIRRAYQKDKSGALGAYDGWKEIDMKTSGKVKKKVKVFTPENEKKYIQKLDITCLFKIIGDMKFAKIKKHTVFLDHNLIETISVNGSPNKRIELFTTEIEGKNDPYYHGLLELAKEYPELQFYILGEISTSDIAKKLLNL
jgi:hypothetical protein